MLINRRNALMAGKDSSCNILHLVDGIDVRSQAAMPNGDFTIAFWYKGFSRSPTYNDVYVFGWKDGGWGGTRFVFASQNIVFRYATGNSSTAYSIAGFDSYAADGIWRHFAVKRDGNTLSCSIDGSSVFSATTSRSHSRDSLPLSIGALGTDADGSYYKRGDKSIGFFCLYNRALSASEVVDLSRVRKLEPSGGIFNGLICGYELSAESQLADVTGNYPLTMHNRSGTTPAYDIELPTI